MLQDSVDDVGERPETAIPIRMDITVYQWDSLDDIAYTEVINFLHFSSDEEYLFDKFDVSECYDTPTERDWLRITFQGG